MSYMKDKIRTTLELGDTIKSLRQQHKLKAVAIAEHSGRSRDVLHRLENGQDIGSHRSRRLVLTEMQTAST